MSTDRDDLTRVLAEHEGCEPTPLWPESLSYACGIVVRDVLGLAEAHRRHLAAALAPLLDRVQREAAAEALEQAADLMVAECSTISAPCFCSGATWIRSRAEAERGGR